jgi:DNA-binding response OmpR family regulator
LEVFGRAIDLRVTRLRKKIEPVPGDPTVIRTVRGHGGGYEYLPSAGPNYGR